MWKAISMALMVVVVVTKAVTNSLPPMPPGVARFANSVPVVVQPWTNRITLSWTGGFAPHGYVIGMSTNLVQWTNVGRVPMWVTNWTTNVVGPCLVFFRVGSS